MPTKKSLIIWRMHKDGVSIDDIAKKFKISVPKVEQIIQEQYLTTIAPPSKEEVRSLLLSGETIDTISVISKTKITDIRKIVSQLEDKEELFLISKMARARKLVEAKKQYWIQHNPIGYLTILDLTREDTQIYADCECVCGKKVQTMFSTLIAGNKLSCGCKNHTDTQERRFHKQRILALAKGELK